MQPTISVQDQERADENACDYAHTGRTNIIRALGTLDRTERLAYLEMARDDIENAILEHKRASALALLLLMEVE